MLAFGSPIWTLTWATAAVIGHSHSHDARTRRRISVLHSETPRRGRRPATSQGAGPFPSCYGRAPGPLYSPRTRSRTRVGRGVTHRGWGTPDPDVSRPSRGPRPPPPAPGWLGGCAEPW